MVKTICADNSKFHSRTFTLTLQTTKPAIMNYLFVLSCLFAICLAVTHGQFFATGTTGRSTPKATTGRPSGTTAGSTLSCVCNCCSGLRCKPVALQTFADATCTTKACQEKCKIFEPKHCDHTFMGTNDAFCTVRF